MWDTLRGDSKAGAGPSRARLGARQGRAALIATAIEARLTEPSLSANNATINT